jgi:hypothetical protein
MGLWGAAQAIAFGLGGLVGTAASDLARMGWAHRLAAYASVFALEACCSWCRPCWPGRSHCGVTGAKPAPVEGRPPRSRLPVCRRNKDECHEPDRDSLTWWWSAAALPAPPPPRPGARGHSVLLLDRAGRIKPCGGAIPPRLIKDFAIPDHLLVARAAVGAHGVAHRQEGGHPDRERLRRHGRPREFDEWLRERAAARRRRARTGSFRALTRDDDGVSVVHFHARGAPPGRRPPGCAPRVIGADGARSKWRARPCPAPRRPSTCLRTTRSSASPRRPRGYDASRCDVFYRGTLSPDFYGWVFPHGDT